MSDKASADALERRPPAEGRRVFGGLVAVRTLGAFADSAMLPFIVLWARHDVGLSGAIAGLLFLAQAGGELVGGLGGGMRRWSPTFAPVRTSIGATLRSESGPTSATSVVRCSAGPPSPSRSPPCSPWSAYSWWPP
jgi:hypothetical protein